MKTKKQIMNDLTIEIEGLKDSFDDSDMEYMGIDEIKLCQEDYKWGRYNEEVVSLMSRINLLKDVLEIEEDEFEKLFDSIKRRCE